MWKNRKLTTTLHLGSIAAVIVSFTLILIVFTFALSLFISNNVAKRVSVEEQILQTLYEDGMAHLTESQAKDYWDIAIPIDFVYLDSENKLIMPDKEWITSFEYKSIKKVGRYIENNPKTVIDNGPNSRLRIGSRSYIVSSTRFSGKYNGTYVEKVNAKEAKNKYRLIIFADITPVQFLLNVIRNILVALMGFQAIISIILIFKTTKRLNKSFEYISEYLENVGRRISVETYEQQRYAEFNQLLQSAENMKAVLKRSQDSKIQFFQDTSHTLLTPLMSIQGYAEGLREGIVKDKDQALNIIISETEKMSQLIFQMNLLSKVASKGIEPTYIYIDEIINESVTAIRGIATTNNIEITSNIHIQEKVFLDAEKMTIAISNILNNGVRYAHSEIRINAAIEDNIINISITNDGPKLEDSEIPMIFQRYYKGKEGNSGIGLSVTEEIIRLHGGGIQAYNLDDGVCFDMCIPQNNMNNSNDRALYM